MVETGFEPRAARLATTLALPYVAGKPVSCDPLPRMKAPVMLPAALTTPAVIMLPPTALPVTDITLEAESNVNPADAPALP